MGYAGVFWRGPRQGHPLRRPHHRRARARGGAGGLAFFLLLFRGAQPRGGWCSSTIARLQGFSSCSPAAVPHQWSSRRMTTSLVVGRSKPGCGLPPALSFKDVHHPCWGGRRAESGLRLSRGLATCFFLQHSGEKGVRQPCEGGELRLRGVSSLRHRQLPCVWLLGLGGFGAASSVASYRLDGAWLSVHRTGDGHVVCRSATPTTSPASPTAPGGCTRRCTPWGRRRRSWMVLSSLHSEDGSKDLFARALGRPPFVGMALVRRWPLSSVLRWSLPLVRLPTAEVVASAGKTVSATCHRTSGSLALMASQSPPVGGRGRGPILNSAHPEVIAAAGEPPGAEVVVAAGAEVVAVAGDPSMQRWSPPLVGLSGASFQRDSCWCSVVHSCRNGAGVPLVRACNDICLRVECNNICMKDFSLGSQVVCSDPLDGGFKY
jgi:hypothetical protein